jgi:hypothetical protein
MKSPLITGFQSYSSVADVKEGILKNTRFEITEDSKLPDGDKRPPFSIYTISLKRYQHLGQSGELRLTFFNNRLMATWFYPEDARQYLHNLEENGLLIPVKDFSEVQFGKSVKQHVNPFTDVLCSTDYRKKIYVSWTDSRLENESNAWIMRYS